MVAYMDNVLVFSRIAQQRVWYLKKLLQLLGEKQWYVNAQKRSYFVRTISF